MRRLVGVVALLAACNGEPIDPPATTTTTTATTNTTTTVEPSGRQPEEYLTLERAVPVRGELMAELQENAWAGWRDPLHVAEHCPWALSPNEGALFSLTRAEMLLFADEGADLDVEGGGYVVRLPQTNRRCEVSHPEHDPRFCGRSEVRRDRLSEFRERLEAHLESARTLRDALRGEPGHGVEYDSIKGWCEAQ